MRRTVLPALLFVLTVPASAEENPVLIEYLCAYGQPSGQVWFGLRHDGANPGIGQSFTFSEEVRILAVDYRFYNTGASNNGVPAIQPGDPIRLALLGDGQQHAVATIPMPEADGYVWLSFDFSSQLVLLAPGSYVFGANTEVPRCGTMAAEIVAVRSVRRIPNDLRKGDPACVFQSSSSVVYP